MNCGHKTRLTRVALIVFFQLAPGWALQAAEVKRPADVDGVASRAAKNTHPVVDRETVVQLDWIAAKTGWTEKDPPKISFASPAQLNEMYFGKASGSNGRTVRALYERSAQTIHLSNTWSPNNVRDRSFLVHELAHHLQLLNHVKVSCGRAYDIRAYQLQFEWLSEQGIRHPQEFVGMDDVVLLSSTQCPLFEACHFLPEGCPE